MPLYMIKLYRIFIIIKLVSTIFTDMIVVAQLLHLSSKDLIILCTVKKSNYLQVQSDDKSVVITLSCEFTCDVKEIALCHIKAKMFGLARSN